MEQELSQQKRAIRRRGVLWMGAGGLAALSAAVIGCGAPAAGTAPSSQTSGQTTTNGQAATAPTKAPAAATTAPAAATPAKFKEAPSLAQMVKDGKLPPVEQRLPAQPLVVKPIEKVGQYGGSWRMTTTGRADGALWTRTVGYEGLVRWSPDWKSILPNLATKWEVSSDATQFTFHLLDGIKWSNGKPLTADDYVYWLEDVAKDPELTVTFPGWLTAGGKKPNIEKVNDTTFKYTFAGPNGLFMQNLATPSGLGIVQPSMYMKQWHKKYSGGESGIQAEIQKRQQLVQEEMKRRGLQGDYQSFYAIMADYTFNPDLPVIYPWKVTKGVGESQVVQFDRNPYFWKVDTDGNQLPYIDQVQGTQHEKVETMVLAALNGEVDFQDRHIASLSNKSVFVDGQQKGNYHLFESVPSSMNTQVLALNLAHKDPEMRKIFQDLRFRQAMSQAINRKEAIDVIYVSQGDPAQPSPLKESEFYNEKLTTQYLDYDPKKANQLLDDMGLTKKDASGMRLRLDGQPLFIAFEVASSSPESVDYLQMVKKYWAAVGVNMEPKVEDRSIFYTRKEANDHDAGIWGGDGGLEVVLEPRWYFPFSNESVYATSWALWFTSAGKQGDEPIEPAKKQMDLYNQLKATGDEKKQADLMKQILQISQEQFYAIGLSRPVHGYGIQRNDFFNVPKVILGAWLYPNPGPINPEQFFTTRK